LSKINQRSGLFDLKDMKGEITLNFDAQLSQLKIHCQELNAQLVESYTMLILRQQNRQIFARACANCDYKTVTLQSSRFSLSPYQKFSSGFGRVKHSAFISPL